MIYCFAPTGQLVLLIFELPTLGPYGTKNYFREIPFHNKYVISLLLNYRNNWKIKTLQPVGIRDIMQ